ncbi:DNA fragmentation factor subunit alpha-like [Chrysoperla carnea]|uniref:DNA fragmentation factor subunit alpha-like n=1 Tax=Chrysoperla carnea TaxID=189513 RepID=UPI001D063B9B|nr:DNA fragmentation factor subunit alpha-like [Chrysoperla carnea]XP_044739654.1 DNA fragmentation factor subunit alpha-like [Chrysoperla carnea]
MSNEDEPESPQKGTPYKITDSTREVRKGIVATSLEDLTSKLRNKFILGPNDPLKVVLEADGTEVDDEEYFATLEPHTNLMFLTGEQKWEPWSPKCRISLDQVDDINGSHMELAGLVDRLQSNVCHVSLLSSKELELLSDMDPDSLDDIQDPDKIFLEQLKEASGRFLSEKRQAQDAMDLLRLYNGSNTTSTEASSAQ